MAGKTGDNYNIVHIPGGTFAVNSNGVYVPQTAMGFVLDLAEMPFNQFRIFFAGGCSEANQSVAIQLATFAGPSTPIHTGGNDIAAITNVGALWDSGWLSRDQDVATITGIKEYMLCTKGTNGTVDLAAGYVEVHMRRV